MAALAGERRVRKGTPFISDVFCVIFFYYSVWFRNINEFVYKSKKMSLITKTLTEYETI